MSKMNDAEYDVVIVGYGYAGAVAAIEAADGGSSVLLLEKMPDPGGLSILSGGGIRYAKDAGEAYRYLSATNDGRIPEPVLRIFADGMAEIPAQLESLAESFGTGLFYRDNVANYPFPGYETFASVSVEVPKTFDGAAAYPQVKGLQPRSRFMFKVLEENIARRDVTVRLSTPVERLIHEPGGEVRGVVVRAGKDIQRITARRAVILACGGFEADPAMRQEYWEPKPVLFACGRGHTGDGIRMAQRAGAALWHMWHFHGSYGLRHTDPDYPYAIRLKRLPDWFPGRESEVDAKMVWILLDQDGRRYMNEYPPYTQDTAHRPMALYDPLRQRFPRIPSHMIFDESGRREYRIGSPIYNDRDLTFDWSEDNLREVELGLLRRADTVEELAGLLQVDASTLAKTIERWNALCDQGRDEDFGRPPASMVPIRTPPFYTGDVWPVVSNTQGGPVHDERQRVLDAYGKPIPGLLEAGEMGSIWGHLYLSGGNLSECLITGRIAGREAAAMPRRVEADAVVQERDSAVAAGE
jgi:succinate dehydrogenase/fumarate reductase flavoprotein subunit